MRVGGGDAAGEGEGVGVVRGRLGDGDERDEGVRREEGRAHAEVPAALRAVDRPEELGRGVV